MLLVHSVDLILKEVANTIWKAYYRGLISEDDADKKFLALLSLARVNIILHDQSEILEDAYKIALENKITIYDALYIAPAQKLGGELVTLDKKQHQVAIKLKVKSKLIRL